MTWHKHKRTNIKGIKNYMLDKGSQFRLPKCCSQSSHHGQAKWTVCFSLVKSLIFICGTSVSSSSIHFGKGHLSSVYFAPSNSISFHFF
ncbi:hypothetical protein ZEAMMB73_Zm00001d036056 [Zea mays]|uniref:Uncharacterized protein n=1 Tax=Zea mays TaxID=4577 RepID=A0A1D6LKI6_MAIZE|nr:hypothetical protein ZEAMMB73_Zm00001d036056 [Zea mays]